MHRTKLIKFGSNRFRTQIFYSQKSERKICCKQETRSKKKVTYDVNCMLFVWHNSYVCILNALSCGSYFDCYHNILHYFSARAHTFTVIRMVIANCLYNVIIAQWF